MRFSEALDTTGTPDKSQFALTFSGGNTTTTATVTAAAFKTDDANAVELTVSPAVTASEPATRISLQYAKGTQQQNPLKDRAGNEVGNSVAAGGHWDVENWTGRPQPQTATVDGTKLTLTFTENLDTTAAPGKDAFWVDGTDTSSFVNAVAFKTGDAKSLELTLNPAVGEGDTGVTVGYDPEGISSNKLKNTATTPVEVGYFGDWPVKNLRDSTAPTLGTAAVNGTTLTLTFSEELDTTAAPAASRFAVSGTASATTVTAVSFKSGDAKSLELTLNPAVVGSDAGVSVSYTKGADANPLKDTAPTPNEVADFSGFLVTNNSSGTAPPPGTTPPGTTPPGPSGEDSQPRRDPVPLQLALWTDRPAYRPGETVRLYHTVNPHDDRGRYRTLVYLERPGGEERRWLAPLSAECELHAEAVDAYGVALDASRPRGLSAADRELAFEGEAPGPGLWQFVLELRPGSADEQASQPAEPLRTRRAWAKFAVAERSVLLNRSGFDREIRSDMTLRADTLYYLGHQLFVHAGATLAIEPGTVLQAWGAHAAIIVEPGGRIVAEGTREAPVVLTCSVPAGYRQPGCWAGLRILGQAPVTRLEGVAPGVLPPERPAYGGTDAEGSSGLLRYVRVEFAGASGDPEAPGPAIGLYGVGSGTLLDHVQVRQSLGDGFAFSGGTVACDHCVASGSAGAGLSWERGWQGGAAHLYVQHGRGGGDGLSGGHDEQGHDREPRSLPILSNVTLVHGAPYDRRSRRAVAVRLADGSAVQLRDLLAAHFRGGALRASGRSRLLFGEGESSLVGAMLWLNGSPQVPGTIAEAMDFSVRNPKLRDVRDFAAPDPRPKARLARPDDRAERLHRGLRPARELARGMDGVRARVRVRHPGAG